MISYNQKNIVCTKSETYIISNLIIKIFILSFLKQRPYKEYSVNAMRFYQFSDFILCWILFLKYKKYKQYVKVEFKKK